MDQVSFFGNATKLVGCTACTQFTTQYYTSMIQTLFGPPTYFILQNTTPQKISTCRCGKVSFANTTPQKISTCRYGSVSSAYSKQCKLIKPTLKNSLILRMEFITKKNCQIIAIHSKSTCTLFKHFCNRLVTECNGLSHATQ